MRDYEDLTAGWNEIVDDLRDHDKADIENIQHLIFETYLFVKQNIYGDSIPRSRLELYKLIVQFCELLGYYSAGMAESLSTTCEAFAMGLCYVIEKEYKGYREDSLPISLNIHVPGGCSDLEADMSTYESFVKEFNENVEWLREEYEEFFDE